MSSFIRKFIREAVSTKWNVGFVSFQAKESIIAQGIKNVRWLKHDFKDRWFADPFIINSDDTEIEVLVEEWVDENRRGRISKLIVSRKDFCLKAIHPLLDLDTHLSFPFFVRAEENLYVIPENSEAGKLSRYCYNRKKDILELDETWTGIEKPLTDAICVPPELSNGRTLILSTEKYDFGGASGNRLGVYEKNTEDKYYERISEIVFGNNSARCAGAIFQDAGKWIRPAQDCNKRYGHKLIFQEIEKDGNGFKLHEILTVSPLSYKWNLGIHTFNLSFDKTLAVVDGYCYRTPFLGNILGTLKIGQFLAKAQILATRLKK